MSTDREEIAARLRAERERLGMTQQDFADIAGASRRSVIDWEKGVASPNSDYLARLAQKGADATFILTGMRQAPGAMPTQEQIELGKRMRTLREATNKVEALNLPAEYQADLHALVMAVDTGNRDVAWAALKGLAKIKAD